MERAKRSTCFVDFSLKKKSQRKKKKFSKVKGRKKETNFFGKVCKTDTFWSGRNLSPVTLCHVGGRGQKRPVSPTQVGRAVGRPENPRGGGTDENIFGDSISQMSRSERKDMFTLSKSFYLK